ncbi:MAG: hypothetical protein WD379_05330 [Dehalococcoidia bacterium]
MPNLLNILPGRRTTEAPAPAPAAGVAPTPRARESLVILVRDAARSAAFRVHTFATAAAAERFIEFWFPRANRHGLIAFWALDDAPDEPESLGCEPAVLVRDSADSGLAYPFSFADSASALEFARREIAAGADARAVLLCWALPVSIAADEQGKAKLNPARPPACRDAAAAAPDPEPPTSQPAASPPAPVPASDLIARARSVLRPDRWPRREAAFQGFGSPVGRF